MTQQATTKQQMQEVIERHLAAEAARDVDGAIAVYTEDVEHDVVGWPTGPVRGGEGARGFYSYLTAAIRAVDAKVTHEYYGDNFCTIEHLYTGVFEGEFMGVPGNNTEATFRMLHVFEFKDGLISRENVWLDGASIIAQLTAGSA